MSDPRFSQTHYICAGLVPLADNYNAGGSSDSVDMAQYGHMTCILLGSDTCAGAGIVTVMGGLTDGAETAAITFTYRYTSTDSKAALGDVLSAPLTSASLTLVEANIKSGMYVLEWNAEDMVVATVRYRYATVVLSAAGTAGIVSMVLIGSQARFQSTYMIPATPIV